jgi:hypothetical protein
MPGGGVRTCAASVWKNTFLSRHSLPMSASGCTTPISLFTAMIDTCRQRQAVEQFAQLVHRPLQTVQPEAQEHCCY